MPRLGLGLAVGNMSQLLPVPATPAVALPNNPAGPVVFVTNKSAGVNSDWFQFNASSGYGRTYWWDGTFTDTAGFFMLPQKTAAGGIRSISAFSTDSYGVNSGYINQLVPTYGNFLSIDASGCSQMNGFRYTANTATLTSLNFTGCRNLSRFELNDQNALRVLNMTGCSAVQQLFVYNTGLSSIVVPPDSVYLFYCTGNAQLKTVTLRGYRTGGFLLINTNNALTNVDLSPVRPDSVQIANNSSLSAITFASAISSANLGSVDISSNNLSAIDLSNLINLYSLNLYNNQLTSIIMPAGFTSLAGTVGTISIYGNELNAAALNNFFTNLGTYAGRYDVYGVGGTILYGGNPGTATCNPSIASAKGWQPIL